MAEVLSENILCILHDRTLAAGLERRLRAELPTGEGQDELTLSDKRRAGRIVIACGDFPEGAEKVFRDFVQLHDRRFQVSMARKGNYGRFRTAHTPTEYLAFQDGK